MDASQDTTVQEPSTHLVGSIVVAAVLFLPTGLIAIAFALRARTWITRGDLVRARRHSRAALAFVIVSIVLGLITYSAIVGGLLALGAFSGG